MRDRRAPDPELVLSSLDAGDRETVLRWAELVGAPWSEIPPLLQLATYVAVLGLAAEMPGLSTSDALAEACEAIGLEDDPDLATRPADSLARSLRRWRGQIVRPRSSDAA
jgi:hypothetical protein